MNDKTMSAGEIVAALRHCPTAECSRCDFYAADARTDCGLGTVAADLIEAKEAELARLAAYENTGLKPEEVCAVAGLASDNCCKTANAIDQLLSDDAELDAYRALGTIAHLRMLVEAEREGRFPLCAAGTVVQTISGPVKIIGVNMRINGSWYYAYRDKLGSVRGYKSDDFGKNVFLTRAEAEAAHGGGEDEQT